MIDPVTPLQPIAVGDPKDPEIAALLMRMRNVWAAHGAEPELFSPRELTRLRKAPGQPSAIPPEHAWPDMAALVRDYLQPARQAAGPIYVYNGYRPEDYNEAVGGASRSRHLDGTAADLMPWVPDANAGEKKRRAQQLARHFAHRYAQGAQIGLGIYGRDSPQVHVDLGRRRTWADTGYWLRQVGGIA